MVPYSSTPIEITVLVSAGVALLSYLLGSLNFALIISRIKGDDIRNHGSGSAGMTNILRTWGKGWAVFTAVGDFGKAVLAIGAGRALFHLARIYYMDAGYIAGLFVMLGHLYPVFFRFKGGKGVMVALGIMFLVNPLVFLVMLLLFLPVVFGTRIVSLASVLGAIVYAPLTWVMVRFQGRPAFYDTLLAAIMGLIVLYKHRSNIKRLIAGTEYRFGSKKDKNSEAE